MNRVFGIGLLLSLVSLNVIAAPLSVHVFVSDAAPAYMVGKAPSGTDVTVHRLDAMQKADIALSLLLANETMNPEYRGLSPKEAYTQAFSKLLNSAEWPRYLQQYQESSSPIEKALRYGIKKLPAYVFNNEHVIYGVPSLLEAMAIYKRKVH